MIPDGIMNHGIEDATILLRRVGIHFGERQLSDSSTAGLRSEKKTFSVWLNWPI